MNAILHTRQNELTRVLFALPYQEITVRFYKQFALKEKSENFQKKTVSIETACRIYIVPAQLSMEPLFFK